VLQDSHGQESPFHPTSPAINSDQGFLDAIRAHPEDDLNRLVYADWLDERSDPRGRYLRLEIELSRLEESDPRCSQLESNLQDLRQGIESGWLEQAGMRFDVWLLGYTPMIKIGVIRAIRSVTSCGLAEVKGLLGRLPSTILADVLREQAEQAREVLQRAPEWSSVAPLESEVRISLRPARAPKPRPARLEA
jgi:uncharacterized protein (TIGR02996 family)